MGHLRDAKAGVEPRPAPDDTLPDDEFELERTLMDAERTMMQIVNLALSLIGFGFSINTFFNDVTTRVAMHADYQARLFGIFLVLLGLLFLCMGIWNQAHYRRKLARRYGAPAGFRAGLHARLTPAFVTALLLLTAGLGALGIMMFRRLL